MNEQLIERIARRLCELRDQDPDEIVTHAPAQEARILAPDHVRMPLQQSPRWQLAADEVRRFVQVRRAMNSVMLETCPELAVHTIDSGPESGAGS